MYIVLQYRKPNSYFHMTTYSVTSWEVLCRGHACSFLSAFLARRGGALRRGAARRTGKSDATREKLASVYKDSLAFAVFFLTTSRRRTAAQCQSYYHAIVQAGTSKPRSASQRTVTSMTEDGGWLPCFLSRNKKKRHLVRR